MAARAASASSLAALVVKLLELGDAALLLGIAAHQLARAGRSASRRAASRWRRLLPLVSDVLVEHEAAERRFGAGDVGARRCGRPARRHRHGARPSSAWSRASLAIATRNDHAEQDQSAASRPAAAAPPRRQSNRTSSPSRRHDVSLDPLTIWRKPKVPVESAQPMQPVARPAAANMPRISPTWSR